MINNLFWERQDTWPSDPPGWLFLGRAVLLVADEMFQDQDGLVEWWRLHAEATNRAPWYLNDDWERSPAVSEANKAGLFRKRDRYRLMAGRWDAVRSEIRDWAESGELSTGTRKPSGGQISPTPPLDWSAQNLSARFYQCEMNPQKPYSGGLSGDGYEQIFVGFDELFERLHDLRTRHGTDSQYRDQRSPGPNTSTDSVSLGGLSEEDATAIKQSVATSKSVSECRNWLEELYCEQKSGLPSKTQSRTDALERWDGTLTGRSFDKAWSEVAKNKPWMRKPGPDPR